MRFTAYIIFVFSVSLVLYFLGYGPIVNVFNSRGGSILNIDCPEGTPFCTDNNVILGAIFSVVLLAVGALILLITGFSAMYIIPAVILIAVLNFLIFPFDFIFSAPTYISVPIVAFFNIISVLAVLNFIRGGT
jgi:hypothetical protein